MARVVCAVTETRFENDSGREIAGVVVVCGRCDHKTESFGTTERSIKRCLVLLKEECPQDEANYYVTEDD